MNRWNIPKLLEDEIVIRDTHCVYCGIKFDSSKQNRRSYPSWEHIVNDAKIISRENIARCCMSCNASKGAKDLLDWFKTEYCKSKNINAESVAKVVREAIDCPPKR